MIRIEAIPLKLYNVVFSGTILIIFCELVPEITNNWVSLWEFIVVLSAPLSEKIKFPSPLYWYDLLNINSLENSNAPDPVYDFVFFLSVSRVCSPTTIIPEVPGSASSP